MAKHTDRWIVRGFKTKQASTSSWSDKFKRKDDAIKKINWLLRNDYVRAELSPVSTITGISLGDMDGYKRKRRK